MMNVTEIVVGILLFPLAVLFPLAALRTTRSPRIAILSVAVMLAGFYLIFAGLGFSVIPPHIAGNATTTPTNSTSTTSST